MEKNNEKQNKRRLGIVLIALLLLLALGATVGFTLAKYVTEGKVESAQATVAKWGVTVTVNADGLFGSKYKNGSIAATDDGIDVKATGEGNVVAPGTGGKLTLSVSGQPEVSAKLTMTLSSVETVFLYKDGAVYAPIKWKVGGEEVTVETQSITTYEAYKAALLSALQAKLVEKYPSKAWEAGSQISVENGDQLISWEWAFGDGSTDVNDTILGNIKAGTESGYDATTSNTTISIGFSAKVEQVQAQ